MRDWGGGGKRGGMRWWWEHEIWEEGLSQISCSRHPSPQSPPKSHVPTTSLPFPPLPPPPHSLPPPPPHLHHPSPSPLLPNFMFPPLPHITASFPTAQVFPPMHPFVNIAKTGKWEGLGTRLPNIQVSSKGEHSMVYQNFCH